MSNRIFRNTGWQCPACGYVYNMGVAGCLNCNRPQHERTKWASTTTITPTPENKTTATTPNKDSKLIDGSGDE